MTGFLSTLFAAILIFTSALESSNESVLGASDEDLPAITEEAEQGASGDPELPLLEETKAVQSPEPPKNDPPPAEPAAASESAAAPEPAAAPKDEPAGPEAAAQHPLALATAEGGMAYVRVEGDVFDSPLLREDRFEGQVWGVAIATRYNEADDEAKVPATVYVAFAAEDALRVGYLDASAAILQDYDETIARIGKDAVRVYHSAAWPLPEAGFAPKLAAAETPESAPEPSAEPIQPVISLSVVRNDGKKATIAARIDGVPEGVAYELQWQNDIAVSGEFVDVPGETGDSVTFDVTPETARCVWRVAVTLLEKGEIRRNHP